MKRTIATSLAIDGERAFNSAMSQAARNMAVLASESRATTSAFGDNAKSIDGLTSRNSTLTKQIDQQEEIIRALAQAVEDASKEYGEADRRTDNYRIKLNNATTSLNKMKGELGNNEDAIKRMQDEMKPEKVSNFSDSLKTLASTAAKGVVAGAKAAGAAIATIGTAAAAAAKKLVNLVDETREYRSDLSKLQQNAEDASVSFEGMKDELSYLTALTGETDSSIEALSNLMATGFGDNQIASAVDALSGAVIKFPDTLKIESLADSLQETVATGAATGQFAELIERLGGDLDSFNEQMAAATTEADRQQVALNWLANSGLTDVTEQYNEANEAALSAAEAQFKLEDSLASLADTVEPSVATLKGGFAGVLTSIVGMINGTDGAAEDFAASTKNLVDAALGQIQTLLPMVSTFLTTFVTSIAEALPEMLPQLADGAFELIDGLINTILSNAQSIANLAADIVTKFMQFLMTTYPTLIKAGIQIAAALMQGLAEALPELIPAIIQGIMDMIEAITDNLDLLLDAGLQLVMGLVEGIIAAIPVLIGALPEIINSIITFVMGAIPDIINAGIQLLTALVDALPTIISSIVAVIPQIIDGIITAVLEALPQIIQAGIDLLIALVDALPTIISTIVKAIPKIISGIVKAIVNNIDKIIKAGIELLVAMVENLPAIIRGIIAAIPEIITAIVSALGEGWSQMANAGLNLIKGIWNGISDAATWLWNKVKGWCSNLVDKIKNFFGIHSPADKFFPDIGENMAKGLGVGFVDSMSKVAADMEAAVPTTLGADISIGSTSGINGSGGIVSATSTSPQFIAQFTGDVYINDDNDIDSLAQKLGSYWQRQAYAYGGTR